MNIGVSIVARETGYRAALQAVINSAGDMACAGAYSAAEAAVKEVGASKADVVLLVITAAQEFAESVIGQIRAESPKTAVIAVATSRESHDILRALSAGALGYLLRSSSFEDICEAIRQVCRGGAPFSPEITPTVLKMLRSLPGAEPTEPMSGREQEILELLRKSPRNKEIAVALRLSVPTVRAHLRTIYLKLRVRSRSEAIRKLGAEPTRRSAQAKAVQEVPHNDVPADRAGPRP